MAEQLVEKFGGQIDEKSRDDFIRLYVGMKGEGKEKIKAKYSKYRPRYFKRILEQVAPEELSLIDNFDFEKNFGISPKKAVKYFILASGKFF